MAKNKRFRYNEEHRQFILDNYKGISSEELAKRFNDKFGTNRKPKHFKAYKSNYGLSSGYNTKFQKGHTPVNKGKTWDDFMSKEAQKRALQATFKQGEPPMTKRPVGSESNWGGYIYVKVAQPDIWKLKHVMIWEEHYGKVGEDNVIIFLDSNKRNFDIDNLKRVSRGDSAYLTRSGYRMGSPELVESGLLLKQIDNRISEIGSEN